MDKKFIVLAIDWSNNEVQTLGYAYKTLESAIKSVLKNIKNFSEEEVEESDLNEYGAILEQFMGISTDDIKTKIDWNFKIEILSLEPKED